MVKTATVFGASGHVGSSILKELLANDVYESVTVVVRKELQLQDPKIRTLIGDFDSVAGLKLDGEEVFISLGTTKRQTPDPQEYYKIDHDYPVLAAKTCLENGARAVFVVTSVAPNVDSYFIYPRTKGEIERDIAKLGFEHSHFFRPSMIGGERAGARGWETVLGKGWNALNPLMWGPLKKYRAIPGIDIGKAMVRAAQVPATAKVNFYEWPEMHDLLTGTKSDRPPNN